MKRRTTDQAMRTSLNASYIRLANNPQILNEVTIIIEQKSKGVTDFSELSDEELLDKIIGFEALYESAERCRKNVGWKASVMSYDLNNIEETIKLERELWDGTYRPRPPKHVLITHPKPRDAVCIAFRDRVYQRSMNDNIIYPAMTESFIKANAACQTNKGTKFARDTLDRFLKEFFRKFGLDGFVLQADIKGYYENMDHEYVEDGFHEKLPEIIYERAVKVLHEQYEGDKGYNPGSQMVQIAGISALNPLDHFIKEQLYVKYYLRYMDDSIHIAHDKAFLEDVLAKEAVELSKVGLWFHPRKTRIYPLSEGIKFLGFTHHISETGKVYRIIDPDNVKEERQKLERMAVLVRKGEMPKRKADECFKAWKAHARNGNSENLIHEMNLFYNSLFTQEKGNLNDLHEADNDCEGTQTEG